METELIRMSNTTHKVMLKVTAPLMLFLVRLFRLSINFRYPSLSIPPFFSPNRSFPSFASRRIADLVVLCGRAEEHPGRCPQGYHAVPGQPCQGRAAVAFGALAAWH